MIRYRMIVILAFVTCATTWADSPELDRSIAALENWSAKLGYGDLTDAIDSIRSHHFDQHSQVGVFGKLFDLDKPIGFPRTRIRFSVCEANGVIWNFDDFLRWNRESTTTTKSYISYF
ncbi:MAG: hypothetical protein IIC51_11955 [Planctomycetes bacterium]|nr:hypothetical protein [Planctomycetota bacterium]